MDELKQGEQGVVITNPYGLQEKVQVRCINSACDLPAKAALFMQQQHGGKGACGFCNHSGVTIDKRFCYPLLRSHGDLVFDHSLRQEAQVMQVYQLYREKMEESGAPWMKLPVVNGLVGQSVFHELSYWRWTLFGSIDFMHLFEGLFSTLMKLWTESKVWSVFVHLCLR